MIKTIDTNEITEEMFKAFRLGDDLSGKIFNLLKAAPEVKTQPIGTLILGGIVGNEYDEIDIDFKSKALEALQEELVSSENPVVLKVYAHPPAIDDETKRMVLEQTNTKAAEPAQSVPAFWASENILKEYLRDNISCVLTTTKCAANTMPLYTVPPAIDETRHKLILVCEYLETVGLMFVSPRVISSQIRAILEAGNGE